MADSFLTRRNNIRRRLKKRGFHAFLVTHPVNVRYLTGFTGGGSHLLVRLEGDVLLSDSRFTIQIEEESPGLEAFIRPAGLTLPGTAAQCLGRTTSGILGVEAAAMTLREHVALVEVLPAWQTLPIDGLVEEFRQIKDRGEVALIRKAIDVAYRAFIDVRGNLRPGQTEIEIRNELEYRMRLHGAEEKSFPTIVGAGPRAALPHAVPGRATWDSQSHLLIDWGAVVDGYMSDLTRVLIRSPKDKKLRKVYETVLKAQQAAIAAIEPGKTGGEIHEIAHAVIRDAGYGRHFTHGLGHAVGMEIHESMRFAGGKEELLRPGMVMTVEPGIYLKGWGGIRIEDDVLITRTGCEVLSRRVPRSFDEMVL